VEINLLLDRPPLSLEDWAAQCMAEGCRTVKVKVRKDDPRTIASCIGGLRKCLGKTIQLRLDANRAFSLAEARELLEMLAEHDITYIEEPVENAATLRKLLPDAAVPVALDETLREIDPPQLADFPGARAVILKPTLLGGIRRVMEFADSAEQLGILPVISGCYESGVGTFALARIAASFRSPSAAGLDTYSRLLEDVLPSRLDFHGCLLRLNPEPRMPR
jgi:O-succinylbenzoate synthase